MVTVDVGGGGGFCTLAVLPPLHPASKEITVVNGSTSTHRRVATATLLKMHATPFALFIHDLPFRPQLEARVAEAEALSHATARSEERRSVLASH